MLGLGKPITDEQLQKCIIQYAFTHYQRRGTVSAKVLNRSLSRWMREYKNEDRLNEIYNEAIQAVRETSEDAYEFMNRMYRFGCITYSE